MHAVLCPTKERYFEPFMRFDLITSWSLLPREWPPGLKKRRKRTTVPLDLSRDSVDDIYIFISSILSNTRCSSNM